MKLIFCHVENFGRLRNFDYRFEEGLNVICRENGWGKSTFSAFLRAMFYGFSGSRRKKAEENERERYRPWQGGIYGGLLVFEAGGKTYEMTRVFGRRESEDEYELRDLETNLLCPDYSARTGEELFCIDRESFSRTVFTGQQDCPAAATDDINALVADLTGRAGDMGDYEAAMKRLAEAANRLTPKRRTGSLYRRAEELERDLTFVGLVGLMDPPRAEVREAVARCSRAGVRPVMITGDHRDTAVAIARDLDILRPGDRAIDGPGLDFLSQEALEEGVERFSVYARVTPEHKMRIVKAWQKKGHVVAMTGDGVNDAPALRAADIGCAMGKTGTDVAKGAADMILTDDNFATVVSAVEQGRGIYANIRKAIHYLLSCNIGEILAIFAATVLPFLESPLTPVQLLWLNLVTDSLPALALGMEPVEEGVMDKAPRGRDEPLFSRAFSLGLVWQGALVGGLTLLAYILGLRYLGGPAVGNTMAFATLTLSQLFHAFDVRSEETGLLRLGVLSNPAMNKAFLAGLALQLAVLLVPPLRGAFGVTGMDLRQWGAVLVLAVTPLLVCEAAKAFRKSMAEGFTGSCLISAQIELEMTRRAAACGVAVYAMSDYLLPGHDSASRRPPALLLGFGALDEESIREGVRRLSDALNIRGLPTEEDMREK